MGASQACLTHKSNHNRCFFVKDTLDQDLITNDHCPTQAPFPDKRMWVDILTKPKQGVAFREDRSVLMNCAVDYTDTEEHDDIDLIEGTLKPETYVWKKNWLNSKRSPVVAGLHKP